MESLIQGHGFGNVESAEAREAYVGDFESPEHAAAMLREHLRKLLQFFENRPLVSPLDLGAVSRSFLKIMLESPCSTDDPSNLPIHLFDSGFSSINWPEFEAAIEVDDASIDAMQAEQHAILMANDQSREGGAA